MYFREQSELTIVEFIWLLQLNIIDFITILSSILLSPLRSQITL